MDPNNIDPHLAYLIPGAFIFGLLFVAIMIVPLWQICKKAGFSPWLSLLSWFRLARSSCCTYSPSRSGRSRRFRSMAPAFLPVPYPPAVYPPAAPPANPNDPYPSRLIKTLS